MVNGQVGNVTNTLTRYSFEFGGKGSKIIAEWNFMIHQNVKVGGKVETFILRIVKNYFSYEWFHMWIIRE